MRAGPLSHAPRDNEQQSTARSYRTAGDRPTMPQSEKARPCGSERVRGCAPLELCAFLPFWVYVPAHDAVHGAFGPDVVEAGLLE